MDIHVKAHKTEMYKKNVINMGTKVYNNLPGIIKEIDDYMAFKKDLKLFLLLQTFYSVEEFVSSWWFICDICLLIIQNINSLFYVELFAEYYLRGFRKYLICVQNILQPDGPLKYIVIAVLNSEQVLSSQGRILLRTEVTWTVTSWSQGAAEDGKVWQKQPV